MIKTSKLVVDYDYDFEMYAIISAVKPFKIAWMLNNILNINLVKEEDLLFEFVKEKSKLYFINYKFESQYSYFRLIKNKACEFINTIKPYLIPELKDYDYFVIFDCQDKSIEIDLDENIRNITSVEFVKKIDVNILKSKENLIF